MKQFLQELKLRDPTNDYCDNQVALHTASNLVFHKV